MLEREENLYRSTDEEKDNPNPLNDFVDPNSESNVVKYNFIVEKFVKQEKKISKRKY